MPPKYPDARHHEYPDHRLAFADSNTRHLWVHLKSGDDPVMFNLSDIADWLEQYPQNFSDGVALTRIDQRLRELQAQR